MKQIQLKSGETVLVDDEDFDNLSCFSWYKSRKYAITNIRISKGVWKSVFMHRMIVDCKPGQYVDHVNNNGFDNRKSNLRICTQAENNRNKPAASKNASGFKGVSLYKKTGKWVAYIGTNGKNKNLGYFDTPEAAHEAYKQAAQQYHGNFARFN